MRLYYIGNRNDYCYHGQRRAEIEGREGEQHELDLMLDLMSTEFGYEFTEGIPEWASCNISDRAEFEEFKNCWKQCKQMLKSRRAEK